VLVHKALNDMEGVDCQECTSSMYAFPSLKLPAGAIAEAARRGQTPDLMYALDLLEATGMVVVPGCGFGQKKGTFHFRTTFLPPSDKIVGCMDRMAAFHTAFLAKHSSSSSSSSSFSSSA